MYSILKQDAGVYPLDCKKAKEVKPFKTLRQASNYWKSNNFAGFKGYFIVLNEVGVEPITIRLESKHFT